jgi:hypothetical protein
MSHVYNFKKSNILMRAIISLVVVCGWIFMTGFSNNDPSITTNNQDKAIIIVQSEDDVKHLSNKKELKVEVSKSLNLATAKTIKKMALDKLKKKAAAKGFTHLLIGESDEGMSISKRNYKVALKGVAFK